MLVFVKSVDGSTITLDVDPTSTTSYVKSLIQAKRGIPADDQRLVFGGKPLRDDVSLADVDVRNESTLHLAMSLLGGMVPSSLLRTAQGHPMNGETYNGHLVSCDAWMNIILKKVICTSRDGDKFWRITHCYIKGTTVKYLCLPDEILDIVDTAAKQPRESLNRVTLMSLAPEPQEPKPAKESQPAGRGRGRGRGGKPGQGGQNRGGAGRGRGKFQPGRRQ